MPAHEISVAPTVPSNLIATVDSLGEAGQASVWSIEKRCEVARFPVDWDDGGQRLALLGDAPALVVTAAYHVHGLSAYALSGKRVWQRKDLKKIQNIHRFRDADGEYCLALGLEVGPLTIVNAKTGKTRRQVRGVREAFFGRAGIALHIVSGAARLEGTTSAKPHRLKLDSFAVLDAAFSDDAVAFSEVGGNLRCFSLSGRPLWEFDFGKEKMHALEVAWSSAHNVWLAVVWSFENGGPYWLYQINNEGQRVAQQNLGSCVSHRFGRSGNVLVISDGRVLDPIRNSVLWKLPAL